MRDPETTALKRAVLLLVVVSAVRWALVGGDVTAPPGETVLPSLLDASRAGAEDQARRATPLAAGERIDPNLADETMLDRLPGIGPATARAIVAARKEEGPFRSAEDLLRVRGVGEGLLARISAHLVFDGPSPVTRASARAGSGSSDRVDINAAGPSDLERLPGIGPSLAARIIAERGKHMFTSVDDLARVPGIGPATIERLRAHVVLGLGR